MERIENRMALDHSYSILATVARCSECEAEIKEGEDYYLFGDECICEDCLRSYLREHRRCG